VQALKDISGCNHIGCDLNPNFHPVGSEVCRTSARTSPRRWRSCPGSRRRSRWCVRNSRAAT